MRDFQKQVRMDIDGRIYIAHIEIEAGTVLRVIYNDARLEERWTKAEVLSNT